MIDLSKFMSFLEKKFQFISGVPCSYFKEFLAYLPSHETETPLTHVYATREDEVIGIEAELNKLQDRCNDGYRRMIVDQIIKVYFPIHVLHHFNDYMRIHFVEVNGKTVCWIDVTRSSDQIFLTDNEKDFFFVRIDASTRKLQGQDIVKYCLRRFS